VNVIVGLQAVVYFSFGFTRRRTSSGGGVAARATTREPNSPSDMPNAIVHQGRGEPGPEARNVAVAIASFDTAGETKALASELGGSAQARKSAPRPRCL
jgi:hypothetical protein